MHYALCINNMKLEEQNSNNNMKLEGQIRDKIARTHLMSELRQTYFWTINQKDSYIDIQTVTLSHRVRKFVLKALAAVPLFRLPRLIGKIWGQTSLKRILLNLNFSNIDRAIILFSFFFCKGARAKGGESGWVLRGRDLFVRTFSWLIRNPGHLSV